MNDRFKFRVWDKKSNNYIKVKMFYIDKFGELFKYEQSKSTVYINAPSPYVMCLCGNNYIVEQCTGLKDKNDKLIYEGDIVKGKATIGEGGFDYIGCIKWYYQSELIGWYVEDKDGGAWELKQIHAKISADNITGEVIGNIHENADLLGEEE